jgi:hypothetical protein
MIGFVYMLEFPDGSIYIGSSRNPRKRLRGHYNSKLSACYDKIRQYSESINDVELFAEIIYRGPDYKVREMDLIDQYRNHPKILNRSLTEVDAIGRFCAKYDMRLIEIANHLEYDYGDMCLIRSYTKDRLDSYVKKREDLLQVFREFSENYVGRSQRNEV